MTDNFENETPKFLAPIEEKSETNEFFTINSQKAAEILGVNRTRLSQLTSQGVFPYERRKVESRSRLFYRLNDLLNYQRKSSFGNVDAIGNNRQIKALVPLLNPAVNSQSENVDLSSGSLIRKHTSLVSAHSRKNVLRQPPDKFPRVLQKAQDLKIRQEERMRNEKIKTTMTHLESHLQKIMQAISHLETAISQLKKSHSHRKKFVFESPRVKRPFKRIKR